MNGLKIKKALFLFFLATVLASCASAPQQKLSAESKQSVKTIALLPITDPENYIAMNVAGAKAFLLGPLGGYLEGKDNEAYSKRFTEKMQQLDHGMGEKLLHEIEKGLISKNYDVVLLDKRPGNKANGEADYSSINTDADVILDVWYRAAGYMSPPNSIGYEPWLFVSSRMVSAEDKSQLYFQAFNYAAKMGTIENVIYYDQIGSKEYPNLDVMIEDASEAGKEIMVGIPLISDGVLNEL